jgi:hypothetical protein
MGAQYTLRLSSTGVEVVTFPQRQIRDGSLLGIVSGCLQWNGVLRNDTSGLNAFKEADSH